MVKVHVEVSSNSFFFFVKGVCSDSFILYLGSICIVLIHFFIDHWTLKNINGHEILE